MKDPHGDTDGEDWIVKRLTTGRAESYLRVEEILDDFEELWRFFFLVWDSFLYGLNTQSRRAPLQEHMSGGSKT